MDAEEEGAALRARLPPVAARLAALVRNDSYDHITVVLTALEHSRIFDFE